MYKTITISGAIGLICLAILRVTPYFDGIAFDKSWTLPIVVVPVLLGACLVFCIATFGCVKSVFKKTHGSKHLMQIAIFPLLAYGAFFVPRPNYVDGMHKTLASTVTSHELNDFALSARSASIDCQDFEKHMATIIELKKKHAKVLSLSPARPCIVVKDDHVRIVYGSGLVKHWGVVIGTEDQFPVEGIPNYMRKKVYDGVWVYHDIW